MVYLLHFLKPIAPGKHTTQHYVGCSDNLAQRIEQHRNGTGARLCAVAKERGIGFVVARVWEGGKAEERRIKGWKNAPRLCPICSGIDGDVDFYARR
jgi:predicted GIY-YIG superfamily endonuclease